MMIRLAIFLFVFVTGAMPLRAEVTSASPTGFIATFREEVKATPEDTWKAIAQLPKWWSDAHTGSGQAANMSMPLAAGACWCERWGEGYSMQHGQVLMVQPGRVIRLRAELGPLQDLAVNGVLTLVTSAQEGKTFLRLTYRVSGAPDAGLEKLAPAVDQVLATQYKRLKALAETGKPD